MTKLREQVKLYKLKTHPDRISEMKQGMSKIRNQVIARTFRELDLIEQWGTGVRRIFAEAKEQHLPEPKIIEIGMRVRMTIFLGTPHEIALSKNPLRRNKLNGGVNGGISGGVNELFEFIQSNPGKKGSDLRAAMERSQRTIERWLKKLRDDDKIEFRGAPKTGGYFPLLDRK